MTPPPPGSPFPPELHARLRAQVPSAATRVQLNAGTLGPWPAPTIAAMRAQLDHEAADRQPPELWTGLGALQGDMRALAARLVACEPTQVALMHASHEALNACLWGLDLAPGDNVVTTDEEHPGLLVPLRIARDRRGVEVRAAAFAADPQAFVDGVLALVDGRTRAVALSHVSWSSGRVAPLRELADALGSVPLIVDGAQGAGALPVQASDGWAAYTVSGQKWSLGPNGAGALALADPTAWAPTNGAFFTVSDPEHPMESPLSTDGRRFEMAQEAYLPMVGWRASLRFLLDEVGGVEPVAEHARACNAAARARLAAAGVLGGGADAAAATATGDEHLLCLHLARADAMAVAALLAERGVVVRGIGAGVLRLSFGFWNDLADVHLACDLVADALA